MIDEMDKNQKSLFYKNRSYDSNRDTNVSFKVEKELKKELEQHLKKDYGNTNKGLYNICMDYLNTKTTERTIYPVYVDLLLPGFDDDEAIKECTITKEDSGLPRLAKDRLTMFNYSRVEKDDYCYQLYEYSNNNGKFLLHDCYSMSDFDEYMVKTSIKTDKYGNRYVDFPSYLLEFNKKLIGDVIIYRFLLNNYLDTYDGDGYFDGSIHKACFVVHDDSSDKRFNIIFEYELSKDCTQIIDYNAYLVDDGYFEILVKNNNKMLYINLYPVYVAEPDYNPKIQEIFDKIEILREDQYQYSKKIETEIQFLQDEAIDLMYKDDR